MSSPARPSEEASNLPPFTDDPSIEAHTSLPPPPPSAPYTAANKPLPPRPTPSRTVSFAAEDEEFIYTPSAPYHTPLYVHIIYTLSCACSCVSLLCFLLGASISHHVPFTPTWTAQTERYTELGLRELMILVTVNIAWTAFNLRRARRGAYHALLPLNSFYDVLIWAALLAFAILSFIQELWDRDGMCWNGQVPEERRGECEYFAENILLPLDLVGAGLPLLIAVLHFVLLVARCSLDCPAWWGGEGVYKGDEYDIGLRRATGGLEEAQRLVVDDEEEQGETRAVDGEAQDAAREPRARDEEEGLIQL